MRKIYELDDHFFTGEASVQPVILWGRDGRPLRERFSKTASEASDYIQTVSPQPGKTIVLVLALGAYETYGLNRNGDGFNEHPYRSGHKPTCGHPECEKGTADGWVARGELLTEHYKSFEQHGKIYRHHQNKDPAKSCGDVLKAFWNPQMHRVELLLALDNSKATDLVPRIADGEYPAVSMGCFLAGTRITLADGTHKSIENVAVGDEVLTHKGRARPVTELHRRPYKGDVYTIRAEAHEPVRCTAEHPFLVARRADVRDPSDHTNFRWRDDAKISPEWAHAECLDPAEHYLLEPILSDVATPDYVNRAFARLLGYYLAEGHTYRNKAGVPSGVVLTVNEADAVLGEIEALCDAFGTRNRPVVTQRRNSAVARNVLIADARLAELCIEHAGLGSKTKSLSASAMRWDPALQRELLGAYANGDGCGTADGALKVSTASPQLAFQLPMLAYRAGLIPSVQALTHKAGKGFSARDTTEFVIHFGKQYAQQLRDVCAKVVESPVLATKSARRIVDGYVVTPIREVTKLYGETEVFNFEVSEDESYVAAGLSAHNCRIKHDVCTICGHRAPTRAQYCDHLKFNMRQVVTGGLQAGALNPSPKFFDISFVVRPADQTGYMLKKVASHGLEVRSSAALGEHIERQEQKQAALKKFSDMEKSLLGVTMDSDAKNPAVDAYRDQVALPAARRMPVIRRTTIRIIAGYKPQNVLSTLEAAGVHLTTAELIQMLMERLSPGLTVPDHALDAATFMQPMLRGYIAEHPDLFDQIMDTGALDLAPRNIEPDIAKHAEEYLEKRSTISDYLMRRLIPDQIRPNEQKHMTDVFTLTDPATGEQYATNRAAAIAADERIARQELAKMIGGAALLTAAHKVVSAGLPPALRPVSAGTAILAGANFLRPNYGQRYQTDQGVDIPVTTELAKVSAASGSDLAVPTLGSAAAITAMAHDYESRLRRGDYVGNPNAPLHSRIYDRLSQLAYEHPAYSFLAALAGYGMGKATLGKFAAYIGEPTLPVQDAVAGPRTNFDYVASKVGALIWP